MKKYRVIAELEMPDGADSTPEKYKEYHQAGLDTLAESFDSYKGCKFTVVEVIDEPDFFDTLSADQRLELTTGWQEAMRDILGLGEGHDVAADWYREQGKEACLRDLGLLDED